MGFEFDLTERRNSESDAAMKHSEECQRILDWAKSSARQDPQYVKHICERYHQRLNREKLERANSVWLAR